MDMAKLYLAYFLTSPYSTYFSLPLTYICTVCQKFSHPKFSHVQYLVTNSLYVDYNVQHILHTVCLHIYACVAKDNP